MKNILISLLFCLCFVGCSIGRTVSTETQKVSTKKTEKSVELREVIAPDGQKKVLKTTTYTTSMSDELAQSEQSRSYEVSNPLNLVKGFTGLGSVGDVVATGLAIWGSIKAKRAAVNSYNKIRDSPPREPPVTESNPKVVRKEEEPTDAS